MAKLETGGCTYYHANRAEADLKRLTGNYFRLDGYTGCYQVVNADGRVICHQRNASNPTLRQLIQYAVDLFESSGD